MNDLSSFLVIIDKQVRTHIQVIPKRERSVIVDVIEQQLQFEPATQTRNRKPIRVPNTIGAT